MSKNVILYKISIFATFKNWLDIFLKTFISIGAIDHFYHFYKLEIVNSSN
jgi:hypothetical protein